VLGKEPRSCENLKAKKSFKKDQYKRSSDHSTAKIPQPFPSLDDCILILDAKKTFARFRKKASCFGVGRTIRIWIMQKGLNRCQYCSNVIGGRPGINDFKYQRF
jgi:hypothetical protein